MLSSVSSCSMDRSAAWELPRKGKHCSTVHQPSPHCRTFTPPRSPGQHTPPAQTHTHTHTHTQPALLAPGVWSPEHRDRQTVSTCRLLNSSLDMPPLTHTHTHTLTHTHMHTQTHTDTHSHTLSHSDTLLTERWLPCLHYLPRCIEVTWCIHSVKLIVQYCSHMCIWQYISWMKQLFFVSTVNKIHGRAESLEYCKCLAQGHIDDGVGGWTVDPLIEGQFMRICWIWSRPWIMHLFHQDPSRRLSLCLSQPWHVTS